MIVTRRRRKPFPWRRFILPLLAIALVVFAIAWPPSRNVITGGPLSPIWQNLSARMATITAPFRFSLVLQQLADAKHQYMTSQTQVADLTSQLAAKDKQIASLNSQIGDLQSQAASSRGGSAPAPSAQPAAQPAAQSNGTTASASTLGADQSPAATAEMRRTAQVWASMDPESVSKVVTRLPIPYVAQVLALMSADDAGAILSSVPPAFAAQLTQENPGLKR